MTSQVGVLHPLRLWAAARRQQAAGIWQNAAGISVFARIAIGNSIIIILGAIGGTLITRIVTERGAELAWIVLMVSVGVVISIALNLYILRAALAPMRELSTLVSRISNSTVQELEVSLRNPDPDTARLAASLSALIEQLYSNNRQLQHLSKRAIRAQEEERIRIARSLHDDTGQALLSLMYTLESLEKHVPKEDQALKDRISDAFSVASDALGSLRRVIRDLRPAVLDDLGLVSATRWYARSKLEAAGVLVEFQADTESLPISSEMNITFFRIAQEAINNISRHAQAEKACIRMGLDQDEIFLDIKDDGIGFQVAGNTAEAIHLNHWGLAGIQERINLVNGRLIVKSAPGKGTHLQVRAPLSSPQGVTDA